MENVLINETMKWKTLAQGQDPGYLTYWTAH